MDLSSRFTLLLSNECLVFVICLRQRITIPEILEDEWFKKGYKPPVFDEKEDTNLDDIEAVFKDSEVCIEDEFCN